MNFCDDDYDFFNEDKKNYGLAWKVNSTSAIAANMQKVASAFKYRSASDLNGYPLMGEYNTYWGGGYVYEMRGSVEAMRGNLSALQSSAWIDRQTRAVFVEFALYNPNINMFAVCEFLIEFLPSGSTLAYVRIDPVTLLNHYRGFALATLVCDIIYVAFIIYSMVNEIRLLIKEGKKHLKDFWSLIEWATIGFSWAAVVIYVYRIYASNEILDFFKKTSGYAYIKMQYVALWNETLGYCLAFCAALGTLKFLKLLRFNKRISFLAATIKHSAKELLAFGFIFFIIYGAFVQLMYLFFQDKTVGFSTFIRAMTTCFQIMLGKFEVQSLMKTHAILGPLLFSAYNIFIVFILLNMFVSIISDTFAKVRADINKQSDDYHMVKFIKTKVRQMVGLGQNNHVDVVQFNPGAAMVYKDQVSYLPEKVDELLYALSEVISSNKLCKQK